MGMKKVVLASGSPRRKELIGWLKIPFEVRLSDFNEESVTDNNAEELVKKLAMQKALAVVDGLSDGVVIGADTVVELDGEVIGKPEDKRDAMRVISKLSGGLTGGVAGKTHRVLTGVVVIDVLSGERYVDYEETKVTFRMVTDEEKKKYVEGKFWEGFAGGYAIQEEAGKFVENVSGSFTNVIGFPLLLVTELLERVGVKVERDVRKIIKDMTGYSS